MSKFKVGDWVKLPSWEKAYEIATIKGNNLTVYWIDDYGNKSTAGYTFDQNFQLVKSSSIKINYFVL